MPKHKVTVEVECDHPEFTEDEALEFVVEHMGHGTDKYMGRVMNLVGVGEFLTYDQHGNDTFIPVKWEVDL